MSDESELAMELEQLDANLVEVRRLVSIGGGGIAEELDEADDCLRELKRSVANLEGQLDDAYSALNNYEASPLEAARCLMDWLKAAPPRDGERVMEAIRMGSDNDLYLFLGMR